MAETPWKDVQDCSAQVIPGIWVMEKGLILFAKLRKLWSTHAKNLQENQLVKTNMLEYNKNFKSHHFKVGQLITV